MAINFEEIRDIAKQKILEKKKRTLNVELTEQEKENVQFYVSELEKYIAQYASRGEQKFTYDCSELSPQVFRSIATTFKNRNPLFFVMRNYGEQHLTIEWTGNNEV